MHFCLSLKLYCIVDVAKVKKCCMSSSDFSYIMFVYKFLLLGEPQKDYPIFGTNILCKLNPKVRNHVIRNRLNFYYYSYLILFEVRTFSISPFKYTYVILVFFPLKIIFSYIQNSFILTLGKLLTVDLHGLHALHTCSIHSYVSFF